MRTIAALVVLGALIGAGTAQADKVGSQFIVAAGDQDSNCIQSAPAGLQSDGFAVFYHCSSSFWEYDNIDGKRYNGAGDFVGSNFPASVTGLSANVGNPAVASANFGNFVVAWEAHRDGLGSDIVAKRFGPAGNALAPPFRVNTTTAGDQTLPSVATLTDGSIVVVWRSQRTSTAVIYMMGQRYSAAGARLGGEFQINTRPAKGTPRVAGLSNGGFVVVWDNAYRVYGSRGFPVENQIALVNRGTRGVAGLKKGGFVIVWSNNGVYGQRHGNLGAAAGTPFQISASGGWTGPVVAALTGGGFVVSWGGVQARTYDAQANATGPASQVNTPDAWDVISTPSIAALSAGGFVVTWTEDGGEFDGRSVLGQRFSAP